MTMLQDASAHQIQFHRDHVARQKRMGALPSKRPPPAPGSTPTRPKRPRTSGSPRGARSDLVVYLQRVFGKDLPPIVDARMPLRLQPIPADAVGANPLSPNSCLLARTAARMYGSKGAAFFKGLAFIDLADEYGYRRLERFIASKQTVSVIQDFDAGKPIGFGFAVVLYPPSRPHTLAVKRRAARKHHRTAAGRVTAELSNANQAVRNATDNARRIAETLTKAQAAGDTKTISKWTRRAKAAAERLVVVRERLSKAQRQADEARAAKPRRRQMDLTTRSGCLGRYCFAADHSSARASEALPA
jgi:hypothetical protein